MHPPQSNVQSFASTPHTLRYLGAYINDGFAPPALPALVAELCAALPSIVGTLPLVNAWAYKYGGVADAADAGIRVHADYALVNFNLWLTPDEFNEPTPRARPSAGGGGAGDADGSGGSGDDDEDTERFEYPGGLTVYGCEAPPDGDIGFEWND